MWLGGDAVGVAGGNAAVLAEHVWLLGRHAYCRNPFGGACVAAFACVVALEHVVYLGGWWVGCHSRLRRSRALALVGAWADFQSRQVIDRLAKGGWKGGWYRSWHLMLNCVQAASYWVPPVAQAVGWPSGQGRPCRCQQTSGNE